MCNGPFLPQLTLYRGAGRIDIGRQTKVAGIRRKLEFTNRVMKVIGEKVDVIPIKVDFQRFDPVMVG